MTFVPHLYIDIGRTGALFTLRETFLYTKYVGGQREELVSSFHHKNLSQDPDEALRKAQDFAKEYGLELTTTRESLADDLRKITRRSAEDVEAERQAIERERENYRIERELALKEKIDNGVFPFGAFSGEKFRDAPIQYINWLIEKKDDFEDLMKYLAEKVAEECADLVLPKPDPDAYYGEPKQRFDEDVTVIRRTSFTRPAYSGFRDEYVFVTTMVNKDGVCFVSITPSFYADPEEFLKTGAMVIITFPEVTLSGVVIKDTPEGDQIFTGERYLSLDSVKSDIVRVFHPDSLTGMDLRKFRQQNVSMLATYSLMWENESTKVYMNELREEIKDLQKSLDRLEGFDESS